MPSTILPPPLRRCLAAVLFGTFALSAAQVTLQVEDFEGPWREQTNIKGHVGRGFRTSNANPRIAETVLSGTADISVAGKYVVWSRGFTSANSKRAFQVEVNSVLLAKTHAGKDRRWCWERAGVVGLPKGVVPVVVHDADVGFECADAIMLTTDETYDPQDAERRWQVFDGTLPDRANPLERVIDECCRRVQARTGPATREEWEARRAQVHQYLAGALGLDPMPERTHLNARVTGTAKRDGYTIENVVFESRPTFYVTANVYTPADLAGPAPAVVVVPGHAMEDGKNYGLYQSAQLGLVKLGFVVLAYDPIGQGERRLPGFGHNMGYGSLLVGNTNEGMIVWDTIRAIDYLVTRPDVDGSRIGLTGNSGGGENTFYTTPFDDRIKAAASFCFVCSFDQWLRHGGNHCICNHLPGIVDAAEEFEILALSAPRPFLTGNGARDPIFPIKGTRDTVSRAGAVFSLLGVADHLASTEVDEKHGWHKPLREAAYGWLCKWLKGEGDGSPIAGPELVPEDAASQELLCFKDGAGMPPDAATVVTLNRQRAGSLTATYGTPSADLATWQETTGAWRSRIWNQFGGQPEAFEPQARVVRRFTEDGISVEAIVLTVEPELDVAALLLRPEGVADPLPGVVIVDDSGKEHVCRRMPSVRELVKQGTAVLSIDPRGTGESAVHENHLTSDTVCLGRPILGQRVHDVVQAVTYMRSRPDVAVTVSLRAQGACSLLGLFAGALGAPVESLELTSLLASYRYALENSQPQPMWIFAPGMLKVVDVPQLLALAAPVPVTVVDPVGYGRKPLPRDVAEAELGYAKAAYELVGKPDALVVKTE